MNDLPVRRLLSLTSAVVGVAVIGVVDFATGFEVRLFPLYFLPVAFVAWRLSRTSAVAVSFVSAATWVVSNWLAGRAYAHPLVWSVNFMSQLVAFCTVGILVAELRQRLLAEQSLSRQDPLTLLPNSRAFYERAVLLLAMARRSGRPIAFGYLDLDNFKKVNDERGHEEGDRALTEVAQVLRDHFRASDLLARLGGDEFVVLLPDIGPDAARASLERVCDLVAVAMRRNQWPVTVSVGAASYVHAPSTVEEAIHEADALMYRAKEGGKNSVLVAVVDSGAETES